MLIIFRFYFYVFGGYVVVFLAFAYFFFFGKLMDAGRMEATDPTDFHADPFRPSYTDYPLKTESFQV